MKGICKSQHYRQLFRSWRKHFLWCMVLIGKHSPINEIVNYLLHYSIPPSIMILFFIFLFHVLCASVQLQYFDRQSAHTQAPSIKQQNSSVNAYIISIWVCSVWHIVETGLGNWPRTGFWLHGGVWARPDRCRRVSTGRWALVKIVLFIWL